MGFVPASICCLEPFPVRRPDPGAPSSQRGAERHLRTETSATCAWLQGHSSACSSTCAWSKVSGIKKIPSQWNDLIKVLGEFSVAVHSCFTFAVKHHFHTYGFFMDPVDFFFLSQVRLSFPFAATSGFNIRRNKVEHFFRAVYSIANIFRNFLLFSNKI